MDKIEITGGIPLRGQIPVAGAKNACLALMPTAILSKQPLTLLNAPRLADIETMGHLLVSLGTEVRLLKNGRVITLSAHGPLKHVADYDIVRKMRASILVLGPLLAREGRAVVSLPGGCAIGARPIDLHLLALRKLGANPGTQGWLRSGDCREGTDRCRNRVSLDFGWCHRKCGHGRVPGTRCHGNQECGQGTGNRRLGGLSRPDGSQNRGRRDWPDDHTWSFLHLTGQHIRSFPTGSRWAPTCLPLP